MDAPSQTTGQSRRRHHGSRSPRRTSSVPATPDQAVSPRSHDSEDWDESKPGQGCSVDELRWYVIRELDVIKRQNLQKEKSDYQCRLGVDVIRAAQGTLEGKLEVLGNDFGKHKTETEASMDKLMHLLSCELSEANCRRFCCLGN